MNDNTSGAAIWFDIQSGEWREADINSIYDKIDESGSLSILSDDEKDIFSNYLMMDLSIAEYLENRDIDIYTAIDIASIAGTFSVEKEYIEDVIDRKKN